LTEEAHLSDLRVPERPSSSRQQEPVSSQSNHEAKPQQPTLF